MQESVWDYPRPPRLEPVGERLRVLFDGILIADTLNGLRLLETSHPPVYYLPPPDVRTDLLHPSPARSVCEFKGTAHYWTLVGVNRRSEAAAWSYPAPRPAYGALRNHLAFYASRVDECWIATERVRPQEGDFYGGWISDRVVGPFKGPPGTTGW